MFSICPKPQPVSTYQWPDSNTLHESENMYNYALNECNIIKKVYTSPVIRFSSRASPPKIRVSSEISVLYCLSNKYFKVIFNALNSELPLIAANKFLKRSSVLEVTDLDSIEEHIYTVIVSFVYLLIIELLYGKISAGRLLWMSEHY